MAFQSGGVCYPTALDANQASAAALPAVSGGSVVSVQSVTASTMSLRVTPLGSSSYVDTVVPHVPLECTLLESADGLAVGWAIALVWLGAAGIVFLSRLVGAHVNGGSHVA